MVADTTRVFPEVTGKNLEGREFELPGDFEGDVNLVLVAFRREQQSMVDAWMPAAEALAESLANLRYYELPVIGRGYTLFRSFIDGGMRAGIADGRARERTITLYLDKAAFREALGITSEDTIYALVLGADGRVGRMVGGPYSAEKRAIVEQAVRELLEVQARRGKDEQAPN